MNFLAIALAFLSFVPTQHHQLIVVTTKNWDAVQRFDWHDGRYITLSDDTPRGSARRGPFLWIEQEIARRMRLF